MSEAGHKPNRVTYLAVMQAYSRAGRPSEVERVLSVMLAASVHPDERCFNALVLAHSNAPPGQRKDAGQVAADFQALVERGFPAAPNGDDGRTSGTGRTRGAHIRQRLMS